MAFIRQTSGEQFHFAVPYNGERFQVTRYGVIEGNKIDHVIVKDHVRDCSIKADGEDAVEIDGLCNALKSGTLSATVLEAQLEGYFEGISD